MAGHSKWANIKHRKARQDAKRSRQWSKCSKAIMVAARTGGGDPAANLALRYAIDDAKAANMPKDTIENAIKKGTGEAGGVQYESVLYEGYGPNGVAVMVDALTDNRNRTAPELRKIFEKFGGNLGSTGCVAFVFKKRGEIFIKRDAGDEETIMAAALEAGAEDVVDADEAWQLLCDPAQLLDVRQALEQAGLPIESAQISMIPDNTVQCTGNDARKVLSLMEALEDHDDVQNVYANFDVPDEALAEMP